MLQKTRQNMGIMFVGGSYIATMRIFISNCIPKELLFGSSTIFKVDRRNILHVSLDALSRELYLFTKFRDVFWIL